MRRSSFITAAAMLATILVTVLFPAGEAGPAEVTGSININSETRITLGNDTNTVRIEGYFSMIEKSGLETVGTISAGLVVSGGEWTTRLSQDYWNDVERNNHYDFILSVEVPQGVSAGQSESYNLILTFYNQLDQEVGTTSTGTLVVVESILDNGKEDDDQDDDDGAVPVEDESVSLIIPIFVIGLIIGLVVALIWAKKNLEIVRSDQGKRRIMFREKDSGHILGRKDEPPIELD
ncbi:MAG: hypothetical protein ACMUHB_03255 [Thermoplasmatota archaeon]